MHENLVSYFFILKKNHIAPVVRNFFKSNKKPNYTKWIFLIFKIKFFLNFIAWNNLKVCLIKLWSQHILLIISYMENENQTLQLVTSPLSSKKSEWWCRRNTILPLGSCIIKKIFWENIKTSQIKNSRTNITNRWKEIIKWEINDLGGKKEEKKCKFWDSKTNKF